MYFQPLCVGYSAAATFSNFNLPVVLLCKPYANHFLTRVSSCKVKQVKYLCNALLLIQKKFKASFKLQRKAAGSRVQRVEESSHGGLILSSLMVVLTSSVTLENKSSAAVCFITLKSPKIKPNDREAECSLRADMRHVRKPPSITFKG